MRLPVILFRARGLTLVEVMVGVAIVGILAAAAVPAVSDMLERRRVTAVANEVVGMFGFAKAIAAERGTDVDVDINWIPKKAPKQPEPMSCMSVTVSDANRTCYCWLPAGQPCPGGSLNGIMLRSFQLRQSSANGVTFKSPQDQDWGSGFTPGRIKITSQATSMALQDSFSKGDQVIEVKGPKRALRVKVNAVGRASICSPNGDMSGFPAC